MHARYQVKYTGMILIDYSRLRKATVYLDFA